MKIKRQRKINWPNLGATSTRLAPTTESRLVLASLNGSAGARGALYWWGHSVAVREALRFVKPRNPEGPFMQERIYPMLPAIVERARDDYLERQPAIRFVTFLHYPVLRFVSTEMRTEGGEQKPWAGRMQSKAKKDFAKMEQQIGRPPTEEEFVAKHRKAQWRHLQDARDRLRENRVKALSRRPGQTARTPREK